MLDRRQWICQEGSSGIRDRDIKEELRLRKERTSGRTIEVEFAKQIVRTSIGLRKMSD
jgi:hypothetical protein